MVAHPPKERNETWTKTPKSKTSLILGIPSNTCSSRTLTLLCNLKMRNLPKLRPNL